MNSFLSGNDMAKVKSANSSYHKTKTNSWRNGKSACGNSDINTCLSGQVIFNREISTKKRSIFFLTKNAGKIGQPHAKQ